MAMVLNEELHSSGLVLLLFFHVPAKTVTERKMVFVWLLDVPV